LIICFRISGTGWYRSRKYN